MLPRRVYIVACGNCGEHVHSTSLVSLVHEYGQHMKQQHNGTNWHMPEAAVYTPEDD